VAKASIIWPSVVSVGVFFFMRSMVTLSAMTFLITPQTQVAAVSVLLLDDAGNLRRAGRALGPDTSLTWIGEPR